MENGTGSETFGVGSVARGPLVSAQEYQHNAERCFELAESSRDPSVRLGLLDMASAWLCVAEQAKRTPKHTSPIGLSRPAGDVHAVGARQQNRRERSRYYHP